MSATHNQHTNRRRWTRRALSAVPLAVIGLLLAPAGYAAATPTTVSVASQRPVLEQGAHGKRVADLQRRLTAPRYDVGPVDGYFGAQTHHAVVAFQKVNDLSTDGIVGPRTRAALERPLRPRPARQLSSKALEVDLSKQVLYLTKNGSGVRILDASTGEAGTATPRGRFHTTRQIDGWRKSRLGLLWRPYYFHGGYAVHGAKAEPDYPASHGCVRVTIEAMNRLVPKLRIGMPVTVHR